MEFKVDFTQVYYTIPSCIFTLMLIVFIFMPYLFKTYDKKDQPICHSIANRVPVYVL